jgi:hypothetical protein
MESLFAVESEPIKKITKTVEEIINGCTDTDAIILFKQFVQDFEPVLQNIIDTPLALYYGDCTRQFGNVFMKYSEYDNHNNVFFCDLLKQYLASIYEDIWNKGLKVTTCAFVAVAKDIFTFAYEYIIELVATKLAVNTKNTWQIVLWSYLLTDHKQLVRNTDLLLILNKSVTWSPIEYKNILPHNFVSETAEVIEPIAANIVIRNILKMRTEDDDIPSLIRLFYNSYFDFKKLDKNRLFPYETIKRVFGEEKLNNIIRCIKNNIVEINHVPFIFTSC